jgi:DeoR/GlpR family transcriptional regulator of sugar metabolism
MEVRCLSVISTDHVVILAISSTVQALNDNLVNMDQTPDILVQSFSILTRYTAEPEQRVIHLESEQRDSKTKVRHVRECHFPIGHN